MLSSSTSTARSRSALTDSTSLGLAASVDLEIIEEIVDRHRHATSFPQIFRPYTDVLQEHDISPTADSAYYNFLLKVGTIRAPSWGDKWDIWKATHSLSVKASSSPPSHSVTEKQSAGPTSYQYNDSPSRSKSKLADVRARLPFLASASSDLDEGYGEEEPAEGASMVHPSRPSPRKQMRAEKRNVSRSLVGYTPTQSMNLDLGAEQEDLLDFQPPIRTSTPVYPRPGTFPPAYSVSDVSHTLDDVTENFSALGLSAIDDQKRPWTPREIQSYRDEPDRMSKLVPRSLEIVDIPDTVREEMERRADEFFEMGLMGRCWDMWSRTSEWYRLAYKNITVARDNLLLRSVLEKWRQSTQYQLTLPNTADRHREHYVQSLVLKQWIGRIKERQLATIEARWTEERARRDRLFVWKKWTALSAKRRKERWESDMTRREKGFVQARKVGLVYRILTHWRVEARSRIAQSSSRLKTIEPLWDYWHDLAMKTRQLNSLYANVEIQNLSHTFKIWRRRLQLAPLEADLAARHQRKLVRKVWDDWRVSQWQSEQSAIFDRRRLLLTGMDRWRKARRNDQDREATAMAFDRRRLIKSTFKSWKIESWGRLLQHIRETRIQHRAWMKWTSSLARIDDIDALASNFASLSLRNRAQSLFSLWRSQHATHQTNHLRAQLVHEEKLKSSILTKWRMSAQIIRDNVAKAEKAHDFFLLRTTLSVWRGQLARVRQADFVEKRRMGIIKSAFDQWREMTGKYANLKRREEAYCAQAEKLTQRRLLSRWTERVVEVKDRELKIARARDVHITLIAFLLWRAAANKLKGYEKLADDSIEIRENEQLRRVFRAWRGRAKREKRLRGMVDTALARRRERTVREVFGRWYEVKRERELDPIAQNVALNHEDALLFGVWDKWRLSTHILPGITADSLRLKRRTLDTWFTALVRRAKEKELSRERDRKLLAEAFELWRDAAGQKVLMAAARQVRRTRPSARVSDVGVAVTDGRRVSGHSTISGGGTGRSGGTAAPAAAAGFASPGPGGRRVTPTLNLDYGRTSSDTDRPRSFSSNPGTGAGAAYPVSASVSGPSSPRVRVQSQSQSPTMPCSETVVSEPVYSRLRSELHRTHRPHTQTQRQRGGSEGEQPPRERHEEERSGRIGVGVDRSDPPKSNRGGGDENGEDQAEAERNRIPRLRPRSGSEMLRGLRESMPGRR